MRALASTATTALAEPAQRAVLASMVLVAGLLCACPRFMPSRSLAPPRGASLKGWALEASEKAARKINCSSSCSHATGMPLSPHCSILVVVFRRPPSSSTRHGARACVLTHFPAWQSALRECHLTRCPARASRGGARHAAWLRVGGRVQGAGGARASGCVADGAVRAR